MRLWKHTAFYSETSCTQMCKQWEDPRSTWGTGWVLWSRGVSLSLSQRWPRTSIITASAWELPRAAAMFHQSLSYIQCRRFKGMHGCESSQAFRCQLLRPPAGIWGKQIGTKWNPSGQCFSKETPLALDTELAASIASHRQEWIARGWWWCLEPSETLVGRWWFPAPVSFEGLNALGARTPTTRGDRTPPINPLKKQHLPPRAGILLILIPSLSAEAQPTFLLAAQESFSISVSLSLQSIITRQKQGLLIKINKANYYLVRMDWMWSWCTGIWERSFTLGNDMWPFSFSRERGSWHSSALNLLETWTMLIRIF